VTPRALSRGTAVHTNTSSGGPCRGRCRRLPAGGSRACQATCGSPGRHEQPHQQSQRRRGAFTESPASAGLGSLRVLLIRHGESANNQLWRQLGHDRAAFEAGRQSDPPLSDDGEAQVDAVAEMLERLPG
jgi:hypothetical protein